MKRILIKYILALLLFTTCTNSTLQAQWVNFGPEGGIGRIKKINGILFGLGRNRLFYSTNNGSDWLVVEGSTTEFIFDVTYFSGKYYVAASSVLYSFTTLSGNWIRLNGSVSAVYTGVYVFNNRLFTTGSSLYYSDDGLSFNASIYPGGSTKGMCILHDTLFTLISTGALYSTDNGQSYSNCLNNSYPGGGYMGNIVSYDNKLFIMAGIPNSNNIFVSSNMGANWVLSNSTWGSSNSQFPISVYDGILYAYMNLGCYKYDTIIHDWSILPAQYSSNNQIVLGVDGSRYFAFDITRKTGYPMVFSDNQGLSWSLSNGQFSQITAGLDFKGENLVAYISTAITYNGSNWSTIDSSITLQHTTYCYDKSNNGYLFIGTNKGVFKSTDNALTWTQHTNGLPGAGGIYYVNDILVWGDTVLVGTDSGPYISYNGALSFTSAYSSNGAVQQFLQVGNRLYASGGNALIRSSNRGVTWTSTGVSGGHDLAWAGSKLFKGDASYTYMSDTGSIAFTTLGYNVNGGFGGGGGIRSVVRIAAYDSLFFVTGDAYSVKKMNVNNPGFFTGIHDNLPYRVDMPIGLQPSDYDGSSLLIHDNKLWLGTRFGSTFYRPLTDFGLVVTENQNIPFAPEEVRVYPNPAVHTFSVQLPFAPEQVMVNLYDISGRLVLTESVQSQEGLITLSLPQGKLPEGLYTVLVQTETQNYRQKLVVKRE